MRILRAEEPVVHTRHLVWVAKDAHEDWGTLTDSVRVGKTFRPNRACVIVVQPADGEAFAEWIQVREEYEGEGWQRCDGTAVLDREHQIILGWPERVIEAAMNHTVVPATPTGHR